jgi:uncharacterized protein (TIGR03000 family)
MYSVVLLMAISNGAEAPAFHRHSCSGSSSCSGAVVASSCSGSCHGGRARHSRRGHGCNGGSSCTGTVVVASSCHGGSSCTGCHGGRHARHGRRGHGCNGGYVACTGSVGCTGGAVAPTTAPTTGGTKEMPKPKEEKPKQEEALNAAPATIVVSLPAEAKLTVDGSVTSSTGANRVFVSPTLNAGRDYTYDLQAEIVRDGKTVSASKRVTVRAGEESSVRIDMPSDSVVLK